MKHYNLQITNHCVLILVYIIVRACLDTTCSVSIGYAVQDTLAVGKLSDSSMFKGELLGRVALLQKAL